MKKIKIRFTGKDWDKLPHGQVPHPFNKFLENKYQLDFSNEPDYVISKESRNFYSSCLLKYPRAKVRILFAGEAFVPDFNIFDYAIGFDRIVFGDRYFRLNTINFFSFDTSYGNLIKSDKTIDLALSKERRFCNFIYSNRASNIMRVRAFQALSKYRHVDAAGSLLRNIKQRIATGQDWELAKIEFQKQYKFTVSIENARYPGYTTEKLLHPMAADSIPIYWGNKDVGIEFNTKSFVNIHEFDSLEEAVERVKNIDEDRVLYEQILKEPWITEQQRLDNHENLTGYHAFLSNIFDQDLDAARRRGDGTWNSRYEETLIKRIKLHEGYLRSPRHRLYRRLQKWKIIR